MGEREQREFLDEELGGEQELKQQKARLNEREDEVAEGEREVAARERAVLKREGREFWDEQVSTREDEDLSTPKRTGGM